MTWKSKLAAVMAVVTSVSGLAACSSDSEDRPDIVVTHSTLGDMVTQLAGGAATVEVLIDGSADPHSHQPSARQAATIADAEMVFTVGLGLEETFASLLEDHQLVIEVGSQLKTREARGGLDPHIWVDPILMIDAADVVADALIDLRPADADGIEARATEYKGRLRRVHDALEDRLSDLLLTQRGLVVAHDGLGYFADRYDLEIAATLTTTHESGGSPSAADVDRAVTALKHPFRRPFVVDETTPSPLVDTVASEAGIGKRRIVKVRASGLGPADSAAADLPGLIAKLGDEIASALERSGP